MRLLIRSMLRHLRQHFLQTFFTMAVSILITGMLAVLFHFASSFQCSLRTAGLEKYGTYHYQYYTKAGTGGARIFEEMGRRFREDRWFSDVQLVEEDSQVWLRLTVAHPGLFTSKTMEKKFDEVFEDCREWTRGENFLRGSAHNWSLWHLTAIWKRKTESLPIFWYFFSFWQRLPQRRFLRLAPCSGCRRCRGRGKLPCLRAWEPEGGISSE